MLAYGDDGLLYRGEVKEINSDLKKALLSFFEFGYTEEVHNLTLIYSFLNSLKMCHILDAYLNLPSELADLNQRKKNYLIFFI